MTTILYMFWDGFGESEDRQVSSLGGLVGMRPYLLGLAGASPYLDGDGGSSG